MTHRTRAAGLGLAALILLGAAAAQPARAAGTTAPDTITFDNLPNEMGRNSINSLANADGGSPTFDGVTFSSNAAVFGDQFGPAGSPIATPHSGNYAFGPTNQTTTLTTTKTLSSLYLGLINNTAPSNGPASSVTISALGANNVTLASLTDILTSTTPSLFDTSSFAAFGNQNLITGYSLVGSNPNNAVYRDFIGDDFSFSAPAPPPAPIVSGTFDFESNTNGQQTTFTDTSGGINATFSTTADTANGGGFEVGRPTGPQSPGFSGNHLENSPGMYNLPLSVGFDQTLLSGSVAFASSGPGTFTVQEFLKGLLVGTASAADAEAGDTLSFGGVAFDSLVLSNTASYFAIDNLSVSSAAPVPEASSVASLGIMLALGLGGLLLRARRRKAQAG